MTSLRLLAHPFSSYCQKVLTALYETGTPFELMTLEDPAAKAELAERWPLNRFPVLDDNGRTIPEATTIIEYIDLYHSGTVKMVPDDPRAALDVRQLDRFFDNYVSTPQQKIVSDRLRAEGDRDPRGVADARAVLDTAYAWLDAHMIGREWAAGGGFSLADCGAAPFLFYADWVHPIGKEHANARTYRERLLARSSVVRVVDEARPFRSYFPGGAPDRD